MNMGRVSRPNRGRSSREWQNNSKYLDNIVTTFFGRTDGQSRANLGKNRHLRRQAQKNERRYVKHGTAIPGQIMLCRPRLPIVQLVVVRVGAVGGGPLARRVPPS